MKNPDTGALATQRFALFPASNADTAGPVDAKDLGLASIMNGQQQARFLNRDGSLNVGRVGISERESQTFYQYCLKLPLSSFMAFVVVTYFLTNVLFASVYFLLGPDAIRGLDATDSMPRFVEAFFFSVQTLMTIGYGHLSPFSFAANVVVSIEALAGLLIFAVVTGLLFARFSTPSAKILFSEKAIVSPYRDGIALMFRIANQRANELFDVNVRVVLGLLEFDGIGLQRKFYELALERSSVMFFPLHWTVTHAVDDKSPIRGMTPEKLVAHQAEIIVLVTGTDDTFQQTVYARSSYKAEEIIWGKRFANIIEHGKEGKTTIDLRRLSELEGDAVARVANK